MTIVNIAIFIICRILLDSEDEFDEPLLQGLPIYHFCFPQIIYYKIYYKIYKYIKYINILLYLI